jgi:hypothetical protein
VVKKISPGKYVHDIIWNNENTILCSAGIYLNIELCPFTLLKSLWNIEQ